MIYNIIILTGFFVSILITFNLVFAHRKIKVKFESLIYWLIGQFLIISTLTILWFINNENKDVLIILGTGFLFTGLYFINKASFILVKAKPIKKDLLIIFLMTILLVVYFLYFNENIIAQVVTLYSAAIYTYVKSVIIMKKHKQNNNQREVLKFIIIMIALSLSSLLRVINILIIPPEGLNYNNVSNSNYLSIIAHHISLIALILVLNYRVTKTVVSLSEEEIHKFNTIFHQSPLSMLMCDSRFIVIDINLRFIELLGYSKSDIIGKKLLELELFNTTFTNSKMKYLIENDTNTYNEEISVIDINNNEIRALLSISSMHSYNQKKMILTLTDISEIHTLKEKLNDFAYYDELTTLPNRRHLINYFNTIKSQQNNFAVASIDLDNFKIINDTHGHQVGDEVLVSLALRLKSKLSDNDFIARYGGDEFIFILSYDNGINDIETKLEKILNLINEEIVVNDHKFNLSASLGLSEYPRHGTELQHLINKADFEMYHVKKIFKSGINQ
ncbi:sensor domain-containing diguanylate cyclase [Acholeplasma granularum]|uniref:sensor domain-containing diguanylate cyclase n=1 Tax=Acholeplasma granularum TaxID=264635 RepID=UPI00047129B2|nr:sensor domain-containing diguanylate cyclase [Acholeplasma granularum]